MRLWHEDLISILPRQQLMGQHRECCALRGNGWGRKHSTVNYVFTHSPYKLYQYHMLVINEMHNRGYMPNSLWQDPLYRGKSCPKYNSLDKIIPTKPIYLEHNRLYMDECIENLASKGIYINV